MKLKGFTLAEVLVTLTLIGIVATLTLPALMTNVQRQQAGPALLRAISTLDTANALFFSEQDTLTFGEACPSYINCFNNSIKQRIGADNGGTNIQYKQFTNTTFPDDYSSDLNMTNGYTTKNGFIYYIHGNGDSVSHLSIDINGRRGPNEFGKDLFRANIDMEDGKVYAEGSKVGPGNNSSTGAWEDGGCDARGVGDPRACAGSIIDNGGRVIYPW